MADAFEQNPRRVQKSLARWSLFTCTGGTPWPPLFTRKRPLPKEGRPREWNYREQKWEINEEEKYEGELDQAGRFIARVDLATQHGELDKIHRPISFSLSFPVDKLDRASGLRLKPRRRWYTITITLKHARWLRLQNSSSDKL